MSCLSELLLSITYVQDWDKHFFYKKLSHFLPLAISNINYILKRIYSNICVIIKQNIIQKVKLFNKRKSTILITMPKRYSNKKN